MKWYTMWLDPDGSINEWSEAQRGDPYESEIEQDRQNIRNDEGWNWYIDTPSFIAAGRETGDIWLAWQE